MYLPQRDKRQNNRRKRADAYIVFSISVLVALMAAGASIVLDGTQRKPPDPILVERGRLSKVVAGIVGAMPESGSEGYVRPSRGQASEFASLTAAMEAGDLEEASRSAASLDYTLVWYEDTSTGRRLLMAREERAPTSGAERGWGTIVADSGGADIVVEVAHPLFDIDTPDVGVELFEATRARILLIAGAHRYSWSDGRTDMAHAPGTAFDAAHEALLPARFVVQPHGFHAREDEGYPDVVLSAGVAPAPVEVRSIYHDVKSAGMDAGLFDGGSRYEDLAGTTNLQGRSTRKAEGRFVHVELARHLRTDRAERSRIVEALAGALNRSLEARRGPDHRG